MKEKWFLTITMGALVLGGLLTVGCVAGGESAAVMQRAGVGDVNGVPPNWDKALPATQRFVVLAAFNNDAIRDNNTGLVWEKSPRTATATWNGARFTCINKNVGGQKGWRLPSIPDLASLIDPSVAPPWFVYFGIGFVDHDSKTRTGHAWCVRCGMSADTY